MICIGDDEQKINYEWPNVISFKKLCIYFSLVLAHFSCHFIYIYTQNTFKLSEYKTWARCEIYSKLII